MSSQHNKASENQFSLRDLFLFTIGAAVNSAGAGYGYSLYTRADHTYQASAIVACTFLSIPVWFPLLLLSGRTLAAERVFWAWTALGVLWLAMTDARP